MSPILAHEKLREFARAVLEQGGSPTAEARLVADHLVDANLLGHDSHGVGMIPTYTWSLKIDALKPAAHARILSDTGTILVVDGCHGYGQVVGPEAMRWAIERAERHHVCVVALRNAHHLGRIGAYAEMAVAAGLVSMHYVNVVGHPAQVAPFGSAEARVNTNPYTCGIPIRGSDPVVLDMATSTIALGKVREALGSGVRVPLGSVLDHLGRPSDDPAVLTPPGGSPPGAMSAFGLHKGSGLAIVNELLGGALAGHWTITTPQDGPPSVFNNMLAILIDPDALGDRDAFETNARAVVDHVHGARPAEGVERVLVPGDPERSTRVERLRDGIPISDGTWGLIVDVALKLGMSQDRVDALTG